MKHTTIEQLSYVVPAFSIGFLLIITSINIYLKIRRKFPATVNCWFCNVNSKVPYANINSWNCPKCEQYNGFNEDGDYNCDIPAQRNAKFNSDTFANASPSWNGSVITDRTRPVNGLCQPCNRNQELKVQQLASFEPENEAYFDEEIEIYRAKLEQAYRLCPRCERHLKRTLNKVKTNILGSKLRQIGAKGFRALDLGLNDSSNKKLVYQKRQLLAHGLSVILIVISLLHWFVTCKQIDVTRGKLDAVFDASTTVQILTVLSYMSAIKIMVANSMYHILSLPMVSMLTSSTQSAIDHLYTYSGGDLWSFINADLVQNIHGHSATEHADNVSSVLLNVCGCFIATILLYLRGLEAQPILTILLWSGNIVVPTMTQGVLDPAQLLIFDVARFTLAWFATTLSLASVFTLPSAKQLAVDKNSSYHQIDEDSSSDISDASDLVSELNLSNLSSVSKRSAWNHSGPLNSTIALSKAPSVASGLSSMHRAPKSMQSLNALGSMHSVNGLGSMHSVSGLATRGRRSPSFETANSFRYDSNATIVREQLNRSAFSPAAPSHRDSFGQRNCITPLSNTFTHAADYRGQMSRPGSRNSMYDIPNDFEGGITQLSINGDATNRRRAQPHGFGSTDRLREPLQQRRPVVFPSRLSVDAPAAGNQSWVAGGFWSNTSPQKKSAFDVNRSLLADRFTADVPAMMSRTSSRSSGFESLANSMVNNSREHSLCDENEMDKTYAYADRLADTTVWSQPQRLADYSAANGIGALSLSNGHHHNARSSAGSVYDSSAASAFAASFGPRHRSVTPRTHSFQDVSQASAANAGKTHANRQLARNIENFISFKHDMPMHSYQRGSLIKLNNDGDGKQN